MRIELDVGGLIAYTHVDEKERRMSKATESTERRAPREQRQRERKDERRQNLNPASTQLLNPKLRLL